MQYLREALHIEKRPRATKVLITGVPPFKKNSFLSKFTRGLAMPIPSNRRNLSELSNSAREEPGKKGQRRWFQYPYPSSSTCLRGRDDGLDGEWSFVMDMAVNELAVNPLSGPSTNRAEAMEVRVMKMITPSTALSVKNTRQRVGNMWCNIRNGFANLVCSISGRSANQRWQDTMAGSDHTFLIKASSDGSLVLVTVKDRAGIRSDSPVQHHSVYQQQGQSPGEQELQASTVSSQHIVPEDVPTQHNTQIPDNEEQLCLSSMANLVADGKTSILELPPPLLERTEYQTCSLEYRYAVQDSDIDVINLHDLSGALVSTAKSPGSPSLESSQCIINDCRYLKHDESFLADSNPPASLLVEEPFSLMETPEYSDHNRNPSCPSPECSAASSEFELAPSKFVIPTIYPGMEQYRPASSCSNEANENWSNISYSLFDSLPQYHHRVISLPVHLRGGGERGSRSFGIWRLFLAINPLGKWQRGRDCWMNL
jgi:hypothetical protein